MSQKSLSNDGNQTDTQEELDILRYTSIPEDVWSEMNEEAIDIVRNAQRRTSQKREGEAEIDIPSEREAFAPEEIDFELR